MSSLWSAKSTTNLKRLVFTSLKPPTELASMLRVSVQNEGELPPEHVGGRGHTEQVHPSQPYLPQAPGLLPSHTSPAQIFVPTGEENTAVATVGADSSRGEHHQSASGLQQSQFKAPRKRRLEKWKLQHEQDSAQATPGKKSVITLRHFSAVTV